MPVPIKIYDEQFNNMYQMMNNLNLEVSKVKDSTNLLSNLVSKNQGYNNIKENPVINNNPDREGFQIIEKQNQYLTAQVKILHSMGLVVRNIYDKLEVNNKLSEKSNSFSENIKNNTAEIKSDTTKIKDDNKVQDNDDTKEKLTELFSDTKKALTALITTAVTSLIAEAPKRVVNDTRSMIESRNDIMYEYGLTDPAEADRIYKMRFLHQAAPYQEYSAPELRKMSRQNQIYAINAGYNTLEQVQAVTDELNEWDIVFDTIDLKSSEMFNNTMKYVDQTGKSVDAIMKQMKESSQDMMVTPDTLESVASSYSRYLRVVSNSSASYTNSMNNLIDTTARLADQGINVESELGDLSNMQFMTMGEISQSERGRGIVSLGGDINKFTQLLRTNPAAAEEYEMQLVKSKFGNLDLSTAEGMEQFAAATYVNRGRSSAWADMLVGKPSEGAEGTVESIDDKLEKLRIQEEQYNDEETKQWTYMTKKQWINDLISYGILNSPLSKGVEAIDESPAGMLIDQGKVWDILTTAINGYIELTLFKKLFGGKIAESSGGGLLKSLLNLGKKGGVESVAGKVTGSALKTPIEEMVEANALGGPGAAGGGLSSLSATLAAPAGTATGVLGGLGTLGNSLAGISGASAATAGGAAALGAGSILGGIGGALGVGAGLKDLLWDANKEGLSDYERERERFTGGAKLGITGLGAGGGAAAGAAIGALFGGVGAVPGALIGAGIGGIGSLLAGDKAGEALQNKFGKYKKEEEGAEESIADKESKEGSKFYNAIFYDASFNRAEVSTSESNNQSGVLKEGINESSSEDDSWKKIGTGALLGSMLLGPAGVITGATLGYANSDLKDNPMLKDISTGALLGNALGPMGITTGALLGYLYNKSNSDDEEVKNTNIVGSSSNTAKIDDMVEILSDPNRAVVSSDNGKPSQINNVYIDNDEVVDIMKEIKEIVKEGVTAVKSLKEKSPDEIYDQRYLQSYSNVITDYT